LYPVSFKEFLLKVIIFLFLSVAFIDVDNSGKEKHKQLSDWSLRPVKFCGVEGGESCSKMQTAERKTRLTLNYERHMNEYIVKHKANYSRNGDIPSVVK
jgi:hypothetical protein